MGKLIFNFARHNIKRALVKLYWSTSSIIIDKLLYFVDYHFFTNLKKIDFPHHNLNSPKVLVIAAHSDDEILGLGGTLLKHNALNHDITVLYVTDGSKSVNPDLTSREMIEIRKYEALNLSKYISKVKAIFLEEKSFDFTVSNNLISEISNVIQNTNPDIIYILSPIDINIDHTYTAQAAFAAVDQINYNGRLCLYEVQTPLTHLYANRFIDITDFINTKKNILLNYKSQKIMFGSFLKVLCCNKLAAIHLSKTKAIEFVRELSKDEIPQLINRSHSIDKNNILIIKQRRLLRTSYKSMLKYFTD